MERAKNVNCYSTVMRCRALASSKVANTQQVTANMADVNYHIALSALGALWPLSPGEPYSGDGRIRDMVGVPVVFK
eukprot:1138961-Pelagomonas_calceolata.AAC.9